MTKELREKMLVAAYRALQREGVPDAVFNTRNPSGAVVDAILALLPSPGAEVTREAALNEAADLCVELSDCSALYLAERIRELIHRRPASPEPSTKGEG